MSRQAQVAFIPEEGLLQLVAFNTCIIGRIHPPGLAKAAEQASQAWSACSTSQLAHHMQCVASTWTAASQLLCPIYGLVL